MGGGFVSTKRAPVLLVLSLLLICCGLEVLYYLEPPREDHTANPGSSGTTVEAAQNYVSFITNETGQASESQAIFTGAEVYYKIYNNYATLTSARSAIDSQNISSATTNAADYIITNRGYQQLRINNNDPVIPKDTNSDRYVYIRLSDSDGDSYQAQVVTGSARISSWSEGDTGVTALGVPQRGGGVGPNKGFNFKSDDNNNPLPVSSDNDAVIGTATEEGVWFVDLWAFSIGRDNSSTPSYSQLLDLGYVVIDEDWFDN